MTEILLYGDIGDPGLDAATLVPLIVDGSGPVDIRIMSGGGNIGQGLTIIAAMQRAIAAGRVVTCYIDGLAASMASVIACAASKTIIAPNALIMIHLPSGGVAGNASDLRQGATELDKLCEVMTGIYAAKTGLSADRLIAMMTDETWLDADLAVSLRFVDAIGVTNTAVASIDVTKFGFRKVPVHPLVRAAASLTPANPATPEEPAMTEVVPPAVAPAAVIPPAAATAAPPAGLLATTAVAALTAADVDAAAATAVAADRTRAAGIRAMASTHNIPADVVEQLVTSGATTAVAQAKILDVLAARGDAARVGHTGGVNVIRDEHDKFMAGAEAWLLTASGQASNVMKAAALRGQKVDLDPGQFRGMKLTQLASMVLERSGIRAPSYSSEAIVGAAFTARNAVTQGTGDFPILLENTMHKTLQAAFAIAPDTWKQWCGIGTVSDFRPNKRYIRGTLGPLIQVNENGEFKTRAIPDGSREQITIGTKGYTVNLTRQAIINDDIGAFTSMAEDIGRSAAMTIEIDAYAMLTSNPVMTSDNIPLFNAAHGNLVAAGSGTAPTIAAVDAMRVLMAQQKDISGNDYLDIRPSVVVAPIGLGGALRIVNGAQFNPTTGLFQEPNIVLGIFKTIVDTPRLQGTPWYVLADPATAPAFEVDFLNGQMEPFVDNRQGWSVDGTEWKVRHDYGMGPLNWRSAIMNAGA